MQENKMSFSSVIHYLCRPASCGVRKQCLLQPSPWEFLQKYPPKIGMAT